MSTTNKTLPAINDLESTRKSINDARKAEELACIEDFVNGDLSRLIEEQNARFVCGTLAILPHGVSYQRFCDYMTERNYSVKSAGTNYGQQLVDVSWPSAR
jgi:hypothetical protein